MWFGLKSIIGICRYRLQVVPGRSFNLKQGNLNKDAKKKCFDFEKKKQSYQEKSVLKRKSKLPKNYFKIKIIKLS